MSSSLIFVSNKDISFKRRLLKQNFTNSLRITTQYRKMDKNVSKKSIILISTKEICSFNITSAMTYFFLKFKSIEDFQDKCNHQILNTNVVVLTGDLNSSMILWDAYKVSPEVRLGTKSYCFLFVFL